MQDRESLPQTLVRAGLAAAEAARVADALSGDFDTVNAHPGLKLELDLAPAGEPGARLVRLGLQAGDEARLMLTRGPAGGFTLSRIDTRLYLRPRLVDGRVDGSLYLSMVEAGVEADTALRLARSFGRRLDLSHDLQSGDRFRLVLQEPRRADGAAAGPAAPVFAELTTAAGAIRLYRPADDAPPGELVDLDSGSAPALLLRTPVDGARITSSFGMRLHPILGFMRMHDGIDFGAPLGAPVLAAGDGVVEEARWSSGYGRWLKLGHAAGIETGYGHLSAWAAGIAPGVHVRQGQVVGYVGESGLATGPHLHYEVFQAGRHVDPAAVASLRLAGGDGASALARARKASLDAMVAALAG